LLSDPPWVCGRIVLVERRPEAPRLPVPQDPQGHIFDARPGDREAPVNAVGLAGDDVLDLRLDPARLVRGWYSLTADGREAADDEGCPKPGQEHGNA
jgi:hypothetical protein